MQAKARIIGIGSYLPERVLSNKDLEQMVETSDEWIVQRTGVRERRIAAPDEPTSAMGVQAARRALEDAKLDPKDLDLIVLATMTPDYIGANTAAVLQTELGACNAAAMDIQAACSGKIYALSVAKAFIESGIYKNVLLVASEKMSAFTNYSDRRTCILFGDGAAATVVSHQGPGFLLKDFSLGADGSEAEVLCVPGGGSRHPTSAETVEQDLHYIRMDGQKVFKNAVRRMTEAIQNCLAVSNTSPETVQWIVPHQANRRIIDATVKRVGMSPDRVYADPVERYGNNSAASVGIAFQELLRDRNVQHGDTVLLVAFGAGFTWGAMTLEKREDV